jgi:hypothetical protein
VARDKEVNLEYAEVSYTIGGAGVPKERELNRGREVCEWEG